MGALARLDIDVRLSVVPSEVPDPIPFPDDRTHHTYDRDQARRFWKVLVLIGEVLGEHHAGFRGRTSPVSFFWGTFDLAVIRLPEPAFYAYPYPKPAGIAQAAITPAGAAWNTTIGEFIMPYAFVQASSDPRATILEFLRSTYDVGADLLGWPSDLTQIDAPGRR